MRPTPTTVKPEDCCRIATVKGIPLYEDPDYGDESPLLALIDGELFATEFWECPDAFEMALFLEEIRNG